MAEWLVVSVDNGLQSEYLVGAYIKIEFKKCKHIQ